MPYKCSLSNLTLKICSSLNSSLNAFHVTTPLIRRRVICQLLFYYDNIYALNYNTTISAEN